MTDYEPIRSEKDASAILVRFRLAFGRTCPKSNH